ncbi:protein phosphatase 2 (formerly 2A), regulatory subunit B'' [Angomonas deanei]|uniref:EF-hand domain/EF-hand domain pair, putative n=1 Tax=Angomonas deanei TaxID=59799 RepID=A0A7G2CQF2_9TRYP|nr:protein phosphatase 2 (formerly 2A), regulatory subunit B'' [Angomonas deanei]CAD2221705.1 EF-hand domain/EF-hand domain pair, putative [Angomonas deanei]|eukprot:EPY21786.1 protein phosphatase 2 (formerly 2A), regulatory subunit B'' [Angomonas deanei]
MSTLKISKDENAHSHIQREFSRLPPVPKLNQKVRLLSGRMRNSSNAPLAKQEANYRHQLILCMQRLSTQCFGVPRYFSFIILKHIQSEMKTTANRGGNNTSSNSLLSGGAATQNIVTAQHVKDFYDKYLRGKDSPRRTFDLLVLSCSLANHELTNIPVTNLYLSPDTSELRTHLLPEDFIAYLECLLQHHPGLSFLHETPDFQIKYLDTVVYRIFYTLDRFDRGRISYSEFVNSTLLDAFRQVDASEDINSILQFFSYEHFYVLYCRFWELDEDRDMLISKEDFVHYAPEDVMNPIVVDRVFEGIGRRKHCKSENEMDYEDFVWFCLSEEDKSTFTSIRYWFRILDLDGDGILSVYELHLFYEATKNIIGQFIAEGLIGFEDVICQVFDMLRLSPEEGIRLGDLLREREAASVALNMLTNVIRFLQFEQRDPFVLHQERLIGGLEQTAWDRFARSEYDRMALEADD